MIVTSRRHVAAARGVARRASSPIVYGWRGRSKISSVGPISTTSAEVHHRRRARRGGGRAEVVRDEQVGEAVLALQVAQQPEHLACDRHVERGRRLVADDQARPRRDRARDRDALLLAARELLRVALGELRASPTAVSRRTPSARRRGARAAAGRSRAARRRCRGRAPASRATSAGPGRPTWMSARWRRKSRRDSRVIAVPPSRIAPASGSTRRSRLARASTSPTRLADQCLAPRRRGSTA